MLKENIFIKLLAILIVLIFTHWFGGLSVNNVEAGEQMVDINGKGIEDDPFIIYTFAGLEKIGTKEYSLDAYYQLGNDIDASPTKDENYNNGQGWYPIGQIYDLKNKNFGGFNGVFDGQGHQISDLYISNKDYGIGLFAVVDTGSIKDLDLVDVEIKGGIYVGGLAGLNNKGTIESSSVIGDVQGGKVVGGLVGYNEGIIKDSHFANSVRAGINAGGLVGVNAGTLENSYATAKVKGDKNLVSIDECSNGDMVGGQVGGLVACNMGMIKKSFASGNVKGEQFVGGLVGSNSYQGRVEDGNQLKK